MESFSQTYSSRTKTQPKFNSTSGGEIMRESYCLHVYFLPFQKLNEKLFICIFETAIWFILLSSVYSGVRTRRTCRRISIQGFDILKPNAHLIE